jgi:hypothetical protein
MATLTDQEVKNVIKYNPNGTFIKWLQAKYKIMRSHVTGIGADSLINQIQGFERENIMKARKKMMLSNKDLIARLMKPRAKIYSAKGGIESYNLATSELIQEWKEFLSHCAGKKTSLKQYIKQEVQKAFDIDPMGLKWVGINDQGEPYPTYKCIMNIYDYEVNGEGTPEYVAFKSTAKEIAQYQDMGIITKDNSSSNPDVYRVVCDGWDRIVINETGEPRILIAIPNIFGQVQGEIVSDILTEDESGKKYWESDLYEVSELLSQFVFARSIYNIAYSQTAYPLMWMQKQTCPTCGGKGKLGVPMNGAAPRPEQGDMNCPECGGSGVYPHVQNSDTFIWEFSKDMTGKVPVPPLGIIDTAIANLEYMNRERVEIETLVTETLWGVAKVFPNARVNDESTKEGGGNTSETAFESKLNEQPKYDKLKEYSIWLGNSIKWYADMMGKIKYEDAYISSAILCGDRYAIESPDEILTRITKAKAAGAPQAVLESLYIEYIETRYENNPLEYRKAYIYYVGEPYFFFTVADVMGWAATSTPIPGIQLLEKQMWGEFMCTLTDQIIASIPDDDIPGTMQKMFREYVTKKYIEDKKADTLLFANDGSMLNIGDNARIKANQARDPKDLGKSYQVTNINGDEVMLKGMAKPYLKAQLERTFGS